MKTMKQGVSIVLFLAVLALAATPVQAVYAATSLYYGEVTLQGGETGGYLPNVWDVTACNLTLTSTIDLLGFTNAVNTTASARIGLRNAGLDTFIPVGAGAWQELTQALAGQIIQLKVNLTATSPTTGSITSTLTGPIGTSVETNNFTGVLDRMEVFYWLLGTGVTQTAVFRDITVSGCLVLEGGMANGAGAFYAEPIADEGGVSPGGKATFAFVARQKGDVSSGHLKFIYDLDGLRLESTYYQWVNISASQALFEGTGTLNGGGSYKFRVRAVDGEKTGSPDRFEIRIWSPDKSFTNPNYRVEGFLSNGQILVHKK